jgi:hypothetical protein
MRDHADNHARTHFETSQRRSPQRAAGAALEADLPHPAPATAPMPVNERAYRRIADPVQLLRPVPQSAGRDATGRDEDEPGYVIHLPIRVTDLAAATRLAYTVAGSLAFLHELDPGETTVSTADDQNNRHRVFCDLLLPDRSRCPQQYEHGGSCGPQPDPEPDNGSVPSIGPENGSVPRQWDRP